MLNFPQPCTKTAQAASLTTLYDAIQKTNLTEVVDTTAKFTCFAPTNDAFQAAGIDLNALSNEQIIDALKYHSIVGDVGYSTAFEDGREYQTLLGVPVTVHKRDNQLFINDVAVQQGNVIMSNGVAHVLSGVSGVLHSLNIKPHHGISITGPHSPRASPILGWYCNYCRRGFLRCRERYKRWKCR